MAEYTWDARELPILEAIAAALETGADPARAARDAVPSITDDQYMLTIESLHEAQYIEAHLIPTGQARLIAAIPVRLLPAGKRAVRQWPSGDPGEALVSAVRRAMEAEPDADRKGRLRKVLDALLNAGQDIVTQVAVGAVKSSVGIP